MNIQSLLADIVVLFIGIFAALAVFYRLIKNDVKQFFNLKSAALQQENRAQILPLRLQAHERLILFTERINPASLLVRLHQQGINIAALQNSILQEIGAEYQHNITQQLYISMDTWQVVRKLKDDTIAMVNNAVQGLPADASGIALSKAILQHLAGLTENPYDLTVQLIKRDIQVIF